MAARGIDFLVKEVGEDIMPPYAGWTPTNIHDKILFDKDFSIDEVVKATVKILGKRLNMELLNRDNDDTLPTIYLCNKEIRKFTREKRLVLTHGDNYIAASPWVSPSSVIVFKHGNVKYYQAGVLGRIDSNPILK
tara:strand:+ start:16203 stop:16607 length:405 start_codon:yes stop_codon:yes gene_type:complete